MELQLLTLCEVIILKCYLLIHRTAQTDYKDRNFI